MKRIGLYLLIAAFLVAAFTCGFIAPDVRANGLNLDKLAASIELMPQRLERLSGEIPDPKGKALPLIETYSVVVERIKADYYGSKKIDEQELTYDAIRGTLQALEDPYTRFMDPESYKKMREENEGNFTGIGAQLDTNKSNEVYIKEPLPNTPAMKAGVKSNDVIIAVDGKSIKGMDILDVGKLIRGKEGTKVKLTLQRPGVAKPIDKVIVRQTVQFQMVDSRMADETAKIGYIRLRQFNEKSDEQFDAALSELEKKNIKGLVFDLRGNPGGLLSVAVDIGSRLIDSGPVVIIQERGGQKNPLYVEEGKHNHKRYPLAVLVDKSSASASEIVSGAIKDDDVGTLVGVTTFGKGRVQTILPLQDGSAVAITTAKYLTPKGTDINKKGINPNIEVEAAEDLDPTDPKTDNQLAAAVEIVKVKLGLLPKGVLDKYEKPAQTAEAAKSTDAKPKPNAKEG
ncbi:MAG: S41 family peptidase [Armatimonadetes bacterium]|nr:S41 family peptidase [Armatimonadota bacterium]